MTDPTTSLPTSSQPPSASDPPAMMKDAGVQPWWVGLVFGGNPLYLISGACILVGIHQVLAPAFSPEAIALASLQAWAAMHLYEVALLAALLLLVLWRKVLDDSVALTLLAAAFIVGASVTLDTLAPAKPWAAIGLGVAGLALAAAKLSAIRRWVVCGVGWWAGGGLAVLLLWTFLMPGLLGWEIANGGLDDQVRPLFLLGWIISLLAVGAMLVGACQLKQTPGRPVGGGFRPGESIDLAPAEAHASAKPPFLRTPTMSWLCVTIMAAAAMTHQYALSYVTLTHPLQFGDFLAGLGLVTLLVLTLGRVHSWLPAPADLWVASLPLGLAGVTMLWGWHQSTLAGELMVINHPAVFMLAMAVGLAVLANLRAQGSLAVIAGCYGLLGGILIYGELARQHELSGAWMWIGVAFLLLVAGFLISVKKQPQAEAEPTVSLT